MHPKISIVIPVFNRLSLLQETLSSISAQTESQWECIMVDDGSEQDTIQYINNYCRSDSRFKMIRASQTRKGGSICRNLGWKAALAEYIMFLDSDDLLPTVCLMERLAYINQNPGFDYWVFDTLHFFNTPGDSSYRWNALIKNTDDLTRFLGHDNPWHTSGPVWTRKALESLGGYDEKAECWQDWEFHIRALLSNCNYKKCRNDKAAALYRKSADSTTNSITGRRNQQSGAQWEVLQSIISVLNQETLSLIQKNALAVTQYRLFENALHQNQFETAKQILRHPAFNWLFTIAEKLALHGLLALSKHSSLGRWYYFKVRRLLQRMNAAVFHNTDSDTFIYHKLLFPK